MVRRSCTNAARSGALIRVAFLLTGDQHAAEDLLQTLFTNAAARRGSRVEITDRLL
jgi:DNA-directed RNA polymerase specialized sigma24 family protein